MSDKDNSAKRRAEQSLGRMLSGRDHPTRDERQEIFDAVVHTLGVGDERKAIRWRTLWILGGVVTAAAALLLVVRPVGDDFRARGAGADVATLELYCTAAGARGPCASGSKLFFRVSPPANASYVAMFSERPDAVVVWYFPAADSGRSIDARRAIDGVLPEAILLDESHPPGDYVVYAHFSDRPLTRDEVRRAVDNDELSATLVRRTVHIAGSGNTP